MSAPPMPLHTALDVLRRGCYLGGDLPSVREVQQALESVQMGHDASEEQLAKAQERYVTAEIALQKITECTRDQHASAAEIARCALGWPSS